MRTLDGITWYAIALFAVTGCSEPDEPRIPASASPNLVRAESTVTPVLDVDTVPAAQPVTPSDPLQDEARAIAEKTVAWYLPVCGGSRFDERRTAGLGHFTAREIKDLTWAMNPETLSRADHLNGTEYKIVIEYSYPVSREVDLLAARASEWEEEYVKEGRPLRARKHNGVWQISNERDSWQNFDASAPARSPTHRLSCDRVAEIMGKL